MLIDWFTVTAQVVNFLILVWLLKHLLYQPILDAIDAREARIAAELADADAIRSEARQQRSEFLQKNEAFEQERAARLLQVTEEARIERQKRLEEARRAGDALLAKRRERLDRDASDLHRAIGLRTQQEVFAIARKALADLAATGLEQQMVAVFLQRLQDMQGPAREDFARALTLADEPVVLRSAFDLPAEQRTALQQALNQAFATELSLRFETAPELVSGIELSTDGQKLAWSMAEYLRSLEQGVDEVLNAQPHPATADSSKSNPGKKSP